MEGAGGARAGKGDRFRHEKNKRKRSTYRGGLIDDAKVNSIKFDYSDDEK